MGDFQNTSFDLLQKVLAVEKGETNGPLTPGRLKEAEMQKLAATIIPGYVDAALVSLECSAERGYRVRAQAAPLDHVKRMCRTIASVSGQLVRLERVGGKVSVFKPPRIPVELPSSLPSLSVREHLVNKMLDALTDGQLGLDETDNTKSLDTETEGSVGAAGNQVASLADLGDAYFYQSLISKGAGGRTGIKISCGPDEIFKLIHDALATRFPLEVSVVKKGMSLTIDDKYRPYKGEVENVVRRIEALTLSCISIEFSKLCGYWEVKPQVPEGEPVIRVLPDGAPVLPLTLRGRRIGSNVVEVQAPFSIKSPLVAAFIQKQISASSSFLSLKTRSNPAAYNKKDFREMLLRIKDDLGLFGVTATCEAGCVRIEIDCSPDNDNLESVATYCDLVSALTPLCPVPVKIKRHFCVEDLTKFCYEQFGSDFDWRLEQSDSQVSIITRFPERMAAERVVLFRSVFGLKLDVVRNPEIDDQKEFRGVGSSPEEQELRHYLPALLPPAIGEAALFTLEGDRLVIFARTKALPRRYIEKVLEDLGALSYQVEIREDFTAQRVKSERLLVDVVTQTLPNGLYLRKVAQEENGFVVHLSRLAEGDTLTSEYIEEVSACAELPVTFSELPLSPILARKLADPAVDEQSRRVLARVVKGDDLLADKAHFLRVLEEVFRLVPTPAKPANLVRRPSVAEVRDLTELRCFSIDPRGSFFKEDVFSIQSNPETDGWILGIHIANAASHVRAGSALDLVARQRVESDSIERPGLSSAIPMLPLGVRADINLMVHQPRETFTLLLALNKDLTIRQGEEYFGLAQVINRTAHFCESVDAAYARGTPCAEIEFLDNFARVNAALFPTKKILGGCYSTTALVGGLIDIFNYHVSALLKEKGIVVPSHDTASFKSQHRFSGPGRIYKSLLSQQQLLAYLENEIPRTQEELKRVTDGLGVLTSDSKAHVLYTKAVNAWNKRKDAKLRLLPSGAIADVTDILK